MLLVISLLRELDNNKHNVTIKEEFSFGVENYGIGSSKNTF